MSEDDQRAAGAPPRSVSIFDVGINDCSVEAILDFILDRVQQGRKAVIANVNIHALNLAYQIPWFRAFLHRADLVFCDGFGVKLAARLLGSRILHRNTPPDWIDSLCSLCVDQRLSIFLLGAKPGTAEKAAHILSARHPGLCIAGTQHGFFDHRAGGEENQTVLEQINRVRPDILIVGFGMPLQERWIAENWDTIDAKIAFPVGAMIDYVAGEVTRAPRWMTDHGLEWLGRLVIEPRRLWRRYLIGNPLFFSRVLRQKLGLLKLD